MTMGGGLEEAREVPGGAGALAGEWAPDVDHGRPDRPLQDRDEIDLARSRQYALLAALLVRAPDASMLARLARLQGTPTPLGLAHLALAETAAAASVESVQREFFELFIGVGRGELLPYASYYLTGFLNDRPLAKLRDDLRQLGLERSGGVFEPEDHLGTLCEIMSGVADGRFAAGLDEERQFFRRHLAPWAARFFADLEIAKAARFYRTVGAVGRIFMEIEADAFAMED